jgi:hypothetical protein
LVSSKISPVAVFLPLKPGPYHDATPVSAGGVLTCDSLGIVESIIRGVTITVSVAGAIFGQGAEAIVPDKVEHPCVIVMTRTDKISPVIVPVPLSPA